MKENKKRNRVGAKKVVSFDSPQIDLLLQQRPAAGVHQFMGELLEKLGIAQPNPDELPVLGDNPTDDLLKAWCLAMWKLSDNSDKQEGAAACVHGVLALFQEYVAKVQGLQQDLVEHQKVLGKLSAQVFENLGMKVPAGTGISQAQNALGAATAFKAIEDQNVARNLAADFRRAQGSPVGVKTSSPTTVRRADSGYSQDNTYHWYFKLENLNAVLAVVRSFVTDQAAKGDTGLTSLELIKDTEWMAARMVFRTINKKPQVAEAGKRRVASDLKDKAWTNREELKGVGKPPKQFYLLPCQEVLWNQVV